ncbi:LLM class flavin-dependent oxidoreductase [Nocardioides sp. YIM 152315]|uniref:LLM class flavin-dependent oxidoreductase n=1 Tax=Nocardioides sp. YIM 152315 TaxID=3031760 RepID=UPI0023DC0D30|nr:LLM class flavin-dependent oxidoreductase [Nocardioides sp. YIM 152315]MDF1603501.1 LLM class flavin-dependent oxidoreductase [Nocardioides sp. YIM 152315]
MGARPLTSTGVVFRPQSPPEDLRAVVEAVDGSGVDELWLWEDCFLEGGLTTAAAALAWSSRVRVGVGLLPVPLRNPALAAMEIATLARLFPDRLTVALGHGVQDWMGQVGARADSPMTLLREHTEAVRDLLRGETVSVSGSYVRLDEVALDWPPPTRPRLLLGARGPRTVALAGEVSDGVLLDSVTDPDVVRGARAAVGPKSHVAAYTEVAPDAADVRGWIDELGAAGADTVVLQAPGDAPDPRPLLGLFG